MCETLAALEEMVAAGEVRHVAVANETAWGVMHSASLTDHRNTAAFDNVVKRAKLGGAGAAIPARLPSSSIIIAEISGIDSGIIEAG